jgi:hypothetical protein
MQRELWRNRWLSCLNELTSLKLQRESWLDKTNSNPHWSFVEFMCSYFDDLGIDNNYEYQLKKEWISKKEFETIKQWHELLDKYNSPKNDDYNHKSIIDDIEWKLIIQKGQKAIKELNKSLNIKETQILTNEIDYTKFK